MQRQMRHHLRIPADFIAKLTTPAGYVLETTIEDISRAGLTISCDNKSLEMILPKGAFFAPLQTVKVKVDFDLPQEETHTVNLSDTMEIVYTRRLSKNVFLLGMEFTELKADQQLIVDQYIRDNRSRQKVS